MLATSARPATSFCGSQITKPFTPGKCCSIYAWRMLHGHQSGTSAAMNVANCPDSKSQLPIEKYNVGILLFDGVEVLDFGGPFEVFSRTRLSPGIESRRSEETAPFRVFTVAKNDAPVTATGELQVVPRYSFRTAPPIELLVIPGGYGTRALLNDRETLDWIRATAAMARKVTSVCTGSLLLAQAGLLDHKRATTHWGALDLLQEISDSRRAGIL